MSIPGGGSENDNKLAASLLRVGRDAAEGALSGAPSTPAQGYTPRNEMPPKTALAIPGITQAQFTAALQKAAKDLNEKTLDKEGIILVPPVDASSRGKVTYDVKYRTITTRTERSAADITEVKRLEEQKLIKEREVQAALDALNAARELKEKADAEALKPKPPIAAVATTPEISSEKLKAIKSRHAWLDKQATDMKKFVKNFKGDKPFDRVEGNVVLQTHAHTFKSMLLYVIRNDKTRTKDEDKQLGPLYDPKYLDSQSLEGGKSLSETYIYPQTKEQLLKLIDRYKQNVEAEYEAAAKKLETPAAAAPSVVSTSVEPSDAELKRAQALHSSLTGELKNINDNIASLNSSVREETIKTLKDDIVGNITHENNTVQVNIKHPLHAKEALEAIKNLSGEATINHPQTSPVLATELALQSILVLNKTPIFQPNWPAVGGKPHDDLVKLCKEVQEKIQQKVSEDPNKPEVAEYQKKFNEMINRLETQQQITFTSIVKFPERAADLTFTADVRTPGTGPGL